MASRVRAGETNVDCSEAADEDSTANDNRIAAGPMTGPARAAKTFSWISGLFSPTPVSDRPAKLSTARPTSMYSTTMEKMVASAARPGVVDAPLVSSLMVRTTSHPQ